MGPGLLILLMGFARKNLWVDPLWQYINAVFHAPLNAIQFTAFDA
jgi:hypothetical protein